MKLNKRIYRRIRLLILVFLVLSFVSATYAWFSYSSYNAVKTIADVQAWNVSFKKGVDEVTNTIIISSSDMYPGMDTITETIKISNTGDADATLNTMIEVARILDIEYLEPDETLTSEQIQDRLAHDFPFHINVSVSDEMLKQKSGTSTFEVSISWPLDAGNDVEDSYWGVEAYKFIEEENRRKQADSSYEIREPIEVVVKVVAAQEIITDESLDPHYILGDIVLFDIVNNTGCTSISATCLKTTIIEINNTIGDEEVVLLPEIKNNYQTSSYLDYNTTLNNITASWNVPYRSLTLPDTLSIVSKDVINSYINKEGFSNIVVGNLSYPGRIDTEIAQTITYGGYYSFSNSRFEYLHSSDCVWLDTPYNVNSAFALEQNTASISYISEKTTDNVCKVVPVILASKTAMSTN